MKGWMTLQKKSWPSGIGTAALVLKLKPSLIKNN